MRRQLVIWLITVLGCSLATEARLQPGYLPVRHFTEEAGLVTNGINEKQSILQDRFGFIWLGTETGLLRYDGYHFRKYLHDVQNETTVRSNFITHLHLDSQGTLWVGTDRGLDRYDETTDAFEHIALKINGDVPKDHFIVDILSDESGRLWVLTTKEIFEIQEESNELSMSSHTGRFKNRIQTDDFEFLDILESTREGEFLIATRANGLLKYKPGNGDIELFVDFLFNAINGSSVLTGLYKDNEDNIWVGTTSGLLMFDPVTKVMNRVAELKDYTINDMIRSNDGLLYIATSAGLLFFNPITKDISAFRHEETEPYSTIRDEIQTVYFDNHNNLWIGTRGHGIDKLSKKTKQFVHYQAHELPNQIALPEILSIESLEDEKYLLGTKKGAFIFDPASQDYRIFTSQAEELREGYITAILRDQFNQYWFSVLHEGLVITDENGRVIRRINQVSVPVLKDCLLETWVLALDNSGNIWAGTQQGIIVLETMSGRQLNVFHESDSVSTTGHLRGEGIRALYHDARGRMWVGSSAGLSMYNPATSGFRYIQFPEDSKLVWGTGSRQNEIGSICESHRNSLWISTLNGIFEFHPEDQGFELLKFPDQIQSSMVISMVTDRSGRLWLSAMNGIWKYDPLEREFTHYSTSDGLIHTSFTTSNFLDSDGSILFGSESGILKFHPDEIRINTYVPPVRITQLSLFHSPVETSDEESPLSTPVYLTDAISLGYWQNVIGFRFSALNYTSTENNTYAYMLEGFDDGWHNVGTRNEAIYTNLDPGTYVFRVRGSNNDGIWNEEGDSITIEILSPWWQTGMAYAFYVIFGLGLITAGYLFQRRRLELNHKLEIEKQEAKRLKELDDSKSRLYANITHEFRTPLTLISGMAAEIKADPEAWAQKGTAIIQRHSAQLLNLVNQMLELSKLESGVLQLQMAHGDIIAFTKYIVESFHSFAQVKNIEIHFLTDRNSLEMDYDPDKYLLIVSNLISNALKFTPDGGNIYVSAAGTDKNGDTFFELKVRDTGVGIGQEIHQIFDRYFQGSFAKEKGIHGTGIGLALTRDLVHLLKGEIYVKSAEGKGAEFRIELPVTNLAAASDEDFTRDVRDQVTMASSGIDDKEELIFSEEIDDELSALPRLLVIEDNLDVANYIHDSLRGRFQIHLENDGQSGIDYAMIHVPELILADIMMPGKDGIQVSSELKQDERTSHIPIIVLTALADRETKLKVLRLGVDDFLTKPFDKEELLLRLNNAIAIRRNLQSRYTSDQEPQLPVDNPSIEKEDQFITRLKHIVDEHIDDDSFGIPHLCRELQMSRTQLHNKIKALTGRSTSRFLRLIRLQKAKSLLTNPEFNVSQVAYDVGFKDPNYFSRVFAEEFGYPPSHLSR